MATKRTLSFVLIALHSVTLPPHSAFAMKAENDGSHENVSHLKAIQHQKDFHIQTQGLKIQGVSLQSPSDKLKSALEERHKKWRSQSDLRKFSDNQDDRKRSSQKSGSMDDILANAMETQNHTSSPVSFHKKSTQDQCCELLALLEKSSLMRKKSLSPQKHALAPEHFPQDWADISFQSLLNETKFPSISITLVDLEGQKARSQKKNPPHIRKRKTGFCEMLNGDKDVEVLSKDETLKLQKELDNLDIYAVKKTSPERKKKKLSAGHEADVEDDNDNDEEISRTITLNTLQISALKAEATLNSPDKEDSQSATKFFTDTLALLSQHFSPKKDLSRPILTTLAFSQSQKLDTNTLVSDLFLPYREVLLRGTKKVPDSTVWKLNENAISKLKKDLSIQRSLAFGMECCEAIPFAYVSESLHCITTILQNLMFTQIESFQRLFAIVQNEDVTRLEKSETEIQPWFFGLLKNFHDDLSLLNYLMPIWKNALENHDRREIVARITATEIALQNAQKPFTKIALGNPIVLYETPFWFINELPVFKKPSIEQLEREGKKTFDVKDVLRLSGAWSYDIPNVLHLDASLKNYYINEFLWRLHEEFAFPQNQQCSPQNYFSDNLREFVTGIGQILGFPALLAPQLDAQEKDIFERTEFDRFFQLSERWNAVYRLALQRLEQFEKTPKKEVSEALFQAVEGVKEIGIKIEEAYSWIVESRPSFQETSAWEEVRERFDDALEDLCAFENCWKGVYDNCQKNFALFQNAENDAHCFAPLRSIAGEVVPFQKIYTPLCDIQAFLQELRDPPENISSLGKILQNDQEVDKNDPIEICFNRICSLKSQIESWVVLCEKAYAAAHTFSLSSCPELLEVHYNDAGLFPNRLKMRSLQFRFSQLFPRDTFKRNQDLLPSPLPQNKNQASTDAFLVSITSPSHAILGCFEKLFLSCDRVFRELTCLEKGVLCAARSQVKLLGASQLLSQMRLHFCEFWSKSFTFSRKQIRTFYENLMTNSSQEKTDGWRCFSGFVQGFSCGSETASSPEEVFNLLRNNYIPLTTARSFWTNYLEEFDKVPPLP